MQVNTHALHTFFTAKSIAVVGASANHLKVGHQVLRNLQLADEHASKKRKLYPINPKSRSILGLKAYASLTEVHDPVEVVIVVTPAPTVLPIIDEVIERNRSLSKDQRVKCVSIISAGFAETSKKGKALQHALATKLTLAKIDLLGPNTLGLINPITHLNASFAQHDIPAGNLALISQSGAMLTALFNAVEGQDIGVSFAVSLGNKADLNENDCLEYALHDPNTRVVALYLESFSDLPTFFELASRISKKKPVLLLKGGVSERGHQASVSHTAALATNQVLLTAAAEQMGFILVNNLEELTNAAFFFARHPHPPENVVVITNAGGPAVNTVDVLSQEKVELAQWSGKSKEFLQHKLGSIAIHNPLDLLGDASPDRFRIAIEIAQRDLNIESILVLVTPQAVTDIPAIVDTLIEIKGKKPLFVSLIGGDDLEKYRQKLRQHHITSTAFPNDLVAILKYMHQVKKFQEQRTHFIVSVPHTGKLPKHVSLSHVAEPPTLPSLEAVFALLEKSDFQVPHYELITTHTLHQLEKISYPCFAKTANISLLHKKELGAVYGKVENVTEARAAYQQLSKFGNEVLFQELIEIEHELLLGEMNDSQFGLYITIGLGGSYTNILADRAYVFLPATKQQLTTTFYKTKAFAALKEDTSICAEVIENMHKLQKLIMQQRWIKSLEINPLVINSHGVWVADIKVGV